MAAGPWIKVRREARSVNQEARQERSAGPEQDMGGGQGVDRGEGRKAAEGRDGRWCPAPVPRRAVRSPSRRHRVLHQHQLGARGTSISFFFCESVFHVVRVEESLWGGRRHAGAIVHARRRLQRGASKSWLKHTGALSVLFEGRPDEGNRPDPLLQSTYVYAMRTSTFTCQFILLAARHDATRAVSISWAVVLRLFIAGLRRSRQSSPDLLLTFPLRVIGSSSPTKVV